MPQPLVRRTPRALRLLWQVLPGVLLLVAARPARAFDVTYAGSGSVEYRAFIGAKTGTQPLPSSVGIDSLTLEVAQKIVVEVSKNINVTSKVCFGCHGVELDQGYAEGRVRDYFNIRAGRINVPIGEFNMRHDPANFTSPSKPLPYAMGDMLHYRPSEFNLGVLPTPYSDNGVELFGTFVIGHRLLIDYSAYLVRGLVGTNDLDFVESRRWATDKRSPTVGGRMVATLGPVSLGGSVAWGYYDASSSLAYLIYGVDLYARWRSLVFRGEFIARQTDYDQSLPGYLYLHREPHFLKAGFYGQVDWTPVEWLTVIARADGLFRRGMPLPGSLIIEDAATVIRATGGLVMRMLGNFMVKVGYEYWKFFGTPFQDQHVVRTALIFSY